MTSATAATTYRVVSTTRTGNDSSTSSIVWTGADLRQLSTQYPPSDILGADPLGHSEIEDGHIRMDYTFEQLVGGHWQEIEDPRVRVTPVTATERAISAELRRQFPGDFITGEDDYPYGQGPYDEDDQLYYCSSCKDAGCPQCMIDDEEEEPQLTGVICINCEQPSDTDEELCTSCEIELQRVCLYCRSHHGETNLQADDLCDSCERYLASRRFRMSIWLDRIKRRVSDVFRGR